MKSAILEKGQQYYTYMRNVFQAIDNEQIKYNWLITNCEAYPEDNELNHLFSQEYIWISGEQLTDAIDKDDFQFVWGIFSGFAKDVTLETILQYELPYADGYKGFWVDNVTIQHPLADIEIVAWDSSLTLFISKYDSLVKKFMDSFPLSTDLSVQNTRQNAEIKHIEGLLIEVLTEHRLSINDSSLYKKFQIWNKLYYKSDDKVKDKDIVECIYRTFKLK